MHTMGSRWRWAGDGLTIGIHLAQNLFLVAGQNVAIGSPQSTRARGTAVTADHEKDQDTEDTKINTSRSRIQREKSEKKVSQVANCHSTCTCCVTSKPCVPIHPCPKHYFPFNILTMFPFNSYFKHCSPFDLFPLIRSTCIGKMAGVHSP